MPAKSKYGFEKLQPGKTLFISYERGDRAQFVDRVHNAVNSWRRRGYRMRENKVEEGINVTMIASP